MSLPGEDSIILIVPDEKNSQHQGLPTRTDEQRRLVDDDNLKIDIDKSDNIKSLPLSGNGISKHFVNVKKNIVLVCFLTYT